MVSSNWTLKTFDQWLDYITWTKPANWEWIGIDTGEYISKGYTVYDIILPVSMNKIIAISSPVDSNYGIIESAAVTATLASITVSMMLHYNYLYSDDLTSGYQALYIGNN